MISGSELLQLVQLISMYCGSQGSGANIEEHFYNDWGGDRGRSAVCFKKIWVCTHNVTDASALTTEAHNCVSKHVRGELK